MDGSTGDTRALAELVALLAILIAAAKGSRDGLASALIRIAGFFAGIIFGVRFAPSLGGIFPDNWEPETRSLAAFFAILVAVSWASVLIARAARQHLPRIGLGPVDRLGGAAIGLLKGMLIVAAVGIAIAFAPVGRGWREAYFSSRVVGISRDVGGVVYRAAQPFLAGPIANTVERLERLLDRPDRGAPPAGLGVGI